jgi:Zn finger protein HypA/HybF involved in hydrogenase expression
MINNKTHQEFIKEMKIKHPKIKVTGKYINNSTKILIKDQFEIEYMVYPGNLLKGKVPNIKSAINKDFAFKVLLRLKQPNITLISNYIDSIQKIIIKDQLGIEYMVSPKKLLFGDNPSIESAVNKDLAFKKMSEQIHKYQFDYSLVKYKTNNQKVTLICNECKTKFNQAPGNHLFGQGCPQCKINNLCIRGAVKTQERAKTIKGDILKIHNNRIKLDKFTFTGAHVKSFFGCNINEKHDYWLATPSNILAGKGCPKCKSSKGEIAIEQFLKKENIKYKTQYRFKECKNKRALPFDFYLIDYNTCIEFDGKQHFIENCFMRKNSLKEIQKTDEIKNAYCKINNIKLLRISYTEFKDIDTIISKFIYI